MSGLFNRIKSRKTASHQTNNNEHEPNPSPIAFDEEGFLCPICHHKSHDHTSLAEHYTQVHVEESTVDKGNTKNVKNEIKKEIEKSHNDNELWKQQFTVSEQSRILLTTELMQQKQRTYDLEEELQLLKKHLKNAHTKIDEQLLEIADFKSMKDIYDAQLVTFTNELLNAKAELKEKHHQVAVLCNDLIPRSTNDDVDVLKRELISVQQRMDEVSLEKEQEIGRLRSVLIETYQYIKKFDQLEHMFDQNVSIYETIINQDTNEIKIKMNEMKQFIKLVDKHKDKFQISVKYMRNCLKENHTEIDQLKQTNIKLNNDLEQQRQSNDKLLNDLEIEQKQTNSYRYQIESLTNEIHELEKTLNEFKNDKDQFIQSKLDGDENEERQNLVRHITQEKDQYEKQSKELRIQIKDITNERQKLEDQCNQISKQYSQIKNEKEQLNDEIDLLKTQSKNNNKEREGQINELKRELKALREQYAILEENFQNTNEHNNNEKRDYDQMKVKLTEQMNRLQQEKNELKQTINQHEKTTNDIRMKLITNENQKEDLQQQLKAKEQIIDVFKTTVLQLNNKLDEKNAFIKRLSTGIHRGIDLAHKTQQYLQKNIYNCQMNLLTTIEQAEKEFQSVRAQTLEQIHEEFTNYLTIVHRMITDNKTKLEGQHQIESSNLIERLQQTEQQLNKVKNDYDQLIQQHNYQKQQFEIQLSELNNKLLKVSGSLSSANQTVDFQREKYEKQISLLESEHESRTKKHEMQLKALTENLASVRSELRNTNEKIATLAQIKSEKADIEARLTISQEERRALLERSLASESKNEKLLLENGQLAKKITDLDAALQEIAREYQAIQIQKSKLTQRRWLNDDDIHECMKCQEHFTVTQRKHHCRNCGNIFCDDCSSKTAIVAASSKKPQRVCDQCYNDLTS